MQVRSLLEERKPVYTNSGDLFRYDYVRVDDPDGKVYLKEIAKIDINEEINSQRPVSVSEMVNRYFRGDLSALGDSSRAVYGDVSGVGSLETLVDLAQTVEFVPGTITEEAAASIPESEVIANAES